MEDLKPVLNNKQYSTVTKDTKILYSTVVSNLTDIIPDDGYHPFYKKHYDLLGYERFMELVNKARAGSDTPQFLFRWMLKNEEIVR